MIKREGKREEGNKHQDAAELKEVLEKGKRRIAEQDELVEWSLLRWSEIKEK